MMRTIDSNFKFYIRSFLLLKKCVCYTFIKILSTSMIKLFALLNVSVILIEKFMTRVAWTAWTDAVVWHYK